MRLLRFAGLVLLCSLAAARAEAAWIRAESANFVVYSESRESRVREQVAQLEDFDRLLRMLTATATPPSPSKLHVYFVRGTEELNAIRPVPSTVAGFYTASPEGVLAVVDETTNTGENNNDILFHEYAHHFMLQYHPAAYPAWYVEGFAEYVMTARIHPDRMEFGHYNRSRAFTLSDRQNWEPWDRILFPAADGRPRPVDAGRFYAQSWLLVHYLVRDEGRRQSLRNYFAALSRGEEPRAAFAAAFQTSLTELNRALRRYPDEMTFTRGTRATAAQTPAVAVSRLAPSADDLLLARAALLAGVPDARRATLLARVRRHAARHNDPFAKRVLAHAEVLYGDPATAEPLLDALLQIAPADAELLYLRGLRHLIAGRADEARRIEEYRRAQGWFVRAHRADADNFPSLYRYAQSLSLDRRFVSENTQNVLLLAAHLAPQVGEIRLAAARMLLRRDQFADAETMLSPLASSAHRAGEATEAGRLLDLARRRQRLSEGEPQADAEEEDAENE
ncbi:MAG TPA: hypothetical protein VF552_14275 [Allosphingosinicella sp.]|jgi:hypothetical protein